MGEPEYIKRASEITNWHSNFAERIDIGTMLDDPHKSFLLHPPMLNYGGLPMGLIKQIMIIVILGTMFLGIAAVNAQVKAELPQFKSGASVAMGVPVDFNILNQRVGAIYDVVESDDSHIVWKFTGSTGDWAFVFADGRIIVASTVDFNLDAKDTLTKELNDVMDIINTVNAGISTEARNKALDLAVYYASAPEIYHRLKYDFNSDFDFTLVVPDCTVNKARLNVEGRETAGTTWGAAKQFYYVDGTDVLSCRQGNDMTMDSWCTTGDKEITDKIPTGLHKITAKDINNPHTMIIEAITSPMPPKTFVLYGPNYIPWINETGKSLTLDDMNSFITGTAINNTN
jgi:hypothetical protein